MNDDAIVRLRAMEPEDLDFLYAMENDKEVWDVGCTNVPYSRYVLHDYIANASNDIYADGHYALRTLHLHQLYAIIATDNMASQQLFSETGFTGRNVLKEWLFDGMTYKDAIVMQKIF